MVTRRAKTRPEPRRSSAPLSTFDGFPPGLTRFLLELRANNDREWFAANRQRYETEVKTPLLAFIEAIRPRLARISPCFRADARANGGSMFRIYRDVRFARDKRPYKEHAACQFRHVSARDAHAPGFYLHLSPYEVRAGGGVWKPPGPALRQIREAIAGNPGRWSHTLGEIRKSGVLPGLVEGDPLKRPPRGFAPDAPHAGDLRLRTFFALRELDPASITGPDFIDTVDATFRAAWPLVQFLCETLELEC